MIFQLLSQIHFDKSLHIIKKSEQSNKLNYITQTVYAVKHKPISFSRGYCCQEINMSDFTTIEKSTYFKEIKRIKQD